MAAWLLLQAALARTIVWREAAAASAESAVRPALADRLQALPGNPAGQRRQRAGQRRLVVRRASGGQPAGPRRLAVPGSPTRPFGVSEPAATTARGPLRPWQEDRRDCGKKTAATVARGPPRPWHGPFESVGDRWTAVITVTVDIVARRGAACMSERPAQCVRQLYQFVDDEP